ncbi:MFS transporter [Azospirillum brasilense]|uniref:MFS transporter n=1 Tax=Azospirillum brasilense TaxID=192 RepID=UPI001EDAEF63|nr:MFS transporter [Azospirillum brasilense]
MGNGSSQQRIIWASTIGTAIEFYDFLIYGVASALIFNKLFFPVFDELVGTLFSFGSFAVGFLARPLGGVLFGHFGDRLGRKNMLAATMLMMGTGTFLIGLLPTYDQIGIWAPLPLILLRLVQGIGVGGEWAGATLLVVEHVRDRRGFYGSLVQTGFPIGVAASTAAFLLLKSLPQDALLSWGWRLPFLFSIVLIAVGAFVRFRLAESPAFEAVRAGNRLSRLPFAEVLRDHWRLCLTVLGLKISEVTWVFIITVFGISFIKDKGSVPVETYLLGVCIAAMMELVTIPLFGHLSDRVGRRPIYLLGAAVSAIMAFPLFELLQSGQSWVVIATIVVAMNLGHGLMFAPLAALIPELFETRIRYSGSSFAYQMASALGGGGAPVIATALMVWSGGGVWVVGAYMATLSAITFTAALILRETAFGNLPGAPPSRSPLAPTERGLPAEHNGVPHREGAAPAAWAADSALPS